MIKFPTFLLLASGILSCTSNHDKLTGGTVDTGNPSISGTVTSEDNPAEGEYSFYLANAGTYFIIAQNPTDTTVGLAQTILPENFDLRAYTKLSLKIYDVRGHLIRTLIDPSKPLPPGQYRYTWDAKDDFGIEVPSGHYIYMFVTPRYKKARKMTLLK